MAAARVQKLHEKALVLRRAAEASEKQHEAFKQEIERPLETLKEIAAGRSRRPAQK